MKNRFPDFLLMKQNGEATSDRKITSFDNREHVHKTLKAHGGVGAHK
jgi:hypothetical protein